MGLKSSGGMVQKIGSSSGSKVQGRSLFEKGNDLAPFVSGQQKS